MIILEKYSAGTVRHDQSGYDYFLPSFINDGWVWNDQQINVLLEKAAIKLGELNSFAKLVPNIGLFIAMHIAKEAVISSRIEGTKTKIDEAMLDESEISLERKDDWREVRNYIKSLNFAIDKLKKLPISSRLLKDAHAILLDGVRGKDKRPGEFRASQNWIAGSGPADAAFVPPHQQYVEELMADLEKFIHNEEINLPDLVKIAIAHYQFETIHPFLDGNGRIGRLLITLFLVDRNILGQPLLYLSAYFEKNKSFYYDNLTLVRTNNDMKKWLKYFLIGVCETSEKAAATLSEVLRMKADLERKINQTFGKKASHANLLLNHLFEKPGIDVKEAMKVVNVSYKSANSLIDDFIAAGILQEITNKSRNRIFSFVQYLKLFEGLN